MANGSGRLLELDKQKDVWADLFSEQETALDVQMQHLCVREGSFIHLIRLWHGIFLWANDIHLARLEYPVNVFDEKDFLLVNLCHTGRCEVELAKGGYVYMAPGILNVTACPPQSCYSYPGGQYGGIEIGFELGLLRERMPDALAAYGIGLPLLRSYAAKGNLLAKMTAAGMAEGKELFRLLCGDGHSVQELRFASLSLLYHLLHGDAEVVDCEVLVSKGQRRIVTEAERMLCGDLGRRYTVEELAGHFGISASALKKYFMAVYGRPVSRYMKEKRMEQAKRLLAASSESVGDIALACGYEHQGKFGMAFKAYAKVSPLEYRRLYWKGGAE